MIFKNYVMTKNNGCMDIKDRNWIVIRICHEEDYCKSNPCLAFCDDRTTFNSSILWNPKQIMEKIAEFQQRFNLLLNESSLTEKTFNRTGTYTVSLF